MSTYEKLSEALGDEVMTDMAEEYFGARKAMDDDLEYFQALIRRLKVRKGRVLASLALLRRLLLDGEEAEAFFRDLGVDLSAFPAPAGEPDPAPCGRPPGGLFLARRYVRALAWAYGCFHGELDAYRHGCWRNDPSLKGRKTVCVNHDQVEALRRDLNERIEVLNTTRSPVCMLQYIREMDPGKAERERIAGAGFGGYAVCDNERADYHPIASDDAGVPAFVEAPEPDQAQAVLKSYGRRLARERPGDVRRVLAEVKSAWRRTAGGERRCSGGE